MERDDLGTVRYFLMELIRKNTGIAAPTVSINKNANEINVRIPGKFKNEASIPSILVQEGEYGKNGKIINSHTLSISNTITLIFYSGNGFDVRLKGQIQHTDMELLQDFFERVFLSEYMVNEHSALSKNTIHTMLELSQKDLIAFDENALVVTMTLDASIVLTETMLDTMANTLNNSIKEFSIKTQTNYLRESDQLKKNLLIQDIEKQFKYTITIHTLDDKMTIHTKPSF